MKRFNFSLESVMTLRRFRKNEAAGKLKIASEERQSLEEQVSWAKRSKEQMEQELVRCLNPSAKAAEIVARQNALTLQRVQEANLYHALQRAIKAEEIARDAVLRAQMELEALQRLKARHVERHRADQDKEDELAAMEFVNAVHHVREG